MTTIRLHKVGVGVQDVEVCNIKVPDLWHIAHTCRPDARDAILQVWHLAHDLKNHIQESP